MNNHRIKNVFIVIFFPVMLWIHCANPADNVATVNCKIPCKVGISWTANKEKAVNSTGGGYRIYYDTVIDGTSNSISVNYSKTSATLSVDKVGYYYVRVNAYSSLNPTGRDSLAYTINAK